MPDQTLINLALLAISASLGISITFWCAVGVARYIHEKKSRVYYSLTRMRVSDVAVIIPAHNEEVAIGKCINALLRIVPSTQIFIASDGSRDRTVHIGRSLGCNVLDIQPNAGKAKALARAIADNDLCARFKAVLIQDADSEIDPAFLRNALPLFDDPDVAVVAGHVLSRWPDEWRLRRGMIYTAYRTRLYRLLQAAFQYGQSWKFTAVSYIAPGFTSMYRTTILSQIDITAPGLVIEDFNMTFEVQRKRLGRIAYTPAARCSSEDPHTYKDYKKQVSRWYLGFWQTARRHGIWPGRFWAALLPLLIELFVISALLLALPVLLLLHLFLGMDGFAFSLADMSVHPVSPLIALAVFAAVDYALTIVVAVVDRRYALLVYGLVFPFLRILDAALFLGAFGKSFFARSDGRWVSPERYGGASGRPDASRLPLSIREA